MNRPSGRIVPPSSRTFVYISDVALVVIAIVLVWAKLDGWG
jgi:hypothetical protein